MSLQVVLFPLAKRPQKLGQALAPVQVNPSTPFLFFLSFLAWKSLPYFSLPSANPIVLVLQIKERWSST